MKLTARDIGKLFVVKLGRPMEYRGFEHGHHLFIYRDPPRDQLAFDPGNVWMIERVRPAAAPVVPKPLTVKSRG